jgi:pimeloyl-ACP methyl ester carboxylesterase
MDDRALRAYVESRARPCPDGTVELAYSPEWEARIYFTGFSDVWDEMRDLRVPLLLIYGAQSDTFSPRALAAMRRVLPNATYQRIEDAGHLVPLEKPGEVANTILDFLKPET